MLYPSILVSYSSTFSSVTVYEIFTPALNSGKLAKLYAQPSASVTILVSMIFPFANKLTVIDSGRLPSWFSLSFHVFVPDTSVVPGVCVFVMLYPSILVS